MEGRRDVDLPSSEILWVFNFKFIMPNTKLCKLGNGMATCLAGIASGR